jgi:inosose dehydratase
MSKIKLGIAPIGWTNDDLPELGKENTFEQCVSEMALSGFTGCEVGNKFPKDPKVLKKALDLRQMQIASAWFGAFFTSKPEEETIRSFIAFRDFLHEMGSDRINVAEQGNTIQGLDVPVFSKKPYFTAEEWKKVLSGLDKLGKLAQDKGMKLCYHHHMGTGVQTTEEIDRLMENTNPDLVYLLYDVGHLVFSGEDPIAILKKYVKRTAHVHLKDIRKDKFEQVKAADTSFLTAVKSGVFTVPGDGMIDFEPMFKILQDNGYEGWYLVEAEQDPALANPLEYAIKARTYIREKTGI